jgi:hypothetical protein
MTIHAMVDIETLATSPRAVILTVGCVKFDPYTTTIPHSDFYHRLDIDAQTAMGREINDDTLGWWSQQAKHVQEEAFSDENRTNLTQFAQEFNKYLVGVDKIWYHGANFDMVLIENLFDQLQHGRTWQFYQLRDSRTLFELMPTDPRKDFDQSNLHNSLEDSRVQARAVQRTYAYHGAQPARS